MSHSVLKAPEILREIFMNVFTEQLDITPEQSYFDGVFVNHATLLNAALCCKACLEPALDTLWWKLDDVADLFQILPAFQKIGAAYVRNRSLMSPSQHRILTICFLRS